MPKAEQNKASEAHQKQRNSKPSAHPINVGKANNITLKEKELTQSNRRSYPSRWLKTPTKKYDQNRRKGILVFSLHLNSCLSMFTFLINV